MKNSPRRLGLLGGTFNPIHNAHLFMAHKAIEACDLDLLLLMPAKDPPHKNVDVPASTRFEMACAASAGDELIEVCDIELQREGKSYTIDTLDQLLAKYPGAELFTVIGSDSLHELHTWFRAKELLKKTTFVNVGRLGISNEDKKAALWLEETYGAKIVLLDAHAPKISSSQIRERIFEGLPIKGLTTKAVETYIYEQGLYLPEDVFSLHQICNKALSAHRFRHTMAVVKTAAELAERYGADHKQVRLAALLHDFGRSVEWDALAHAPIGEELVRTKLQVKDEEVLHAIRVHTTLCVNATLLDKIVYLADMIEPGRNFPGLSELRELAYVDIDRAVLLGLTHTMEYLKSKNINIDKASIEAREYFVKLVGASGAD